VEGDWIKEVFVKKVGNGGNTSFWHDVWCGLGTLREAFPRLFQLSLHPEATIKDFGEWENGSWRWHFEWRRSFFVWEESLCGQLMDVLASISLSHNDDVWEFRPDRGGTYTVKENYLFLCHSFGPSSSLGLETSRLVEGVWASWAPSKVVVFSWQLLLMCLPTRVNLAKRGVIPIGEQACWYCGSACNETEDHLFFALSVYSASLVRDLQVVWSCGSIVGQYRGYVSLLFPFSQAI
jgi:hypothetical protein